MYLAFEKEYKEFIVIKINFNTIKNNGEKHFYNKDNLVHNRPVHTIVPRVFPPHRDLLRQLLHNNQKKSIRLYIAIFLRCLLSLLTSSYVVSNLAAPSTALQARRPYLYDTPFGQPSTRLLSYGLLLLN